MANLTQDQKDTTTQDLFCDTSVLGVHQQIVISAFNIPLAVTAFLGNVLIIVALQKPSPLHPPSKLLLGSLAITDLCVGLISHPLRVTYLMSPEDCKRRCCYTIIFCNSTSFFFCGVSLFTLTAISVDRLLALMLGLRYKHVVTLGRVWVFVVILWLSAIAIAVTLIYNSSISEYVICAIMLLCLITSTFCYTKIYLRLRQHQAQLQDHVQQGQSNRRGIPLNIARYRKTLFSALWVQLTLVACYLPFGIITAIFAVTEMNTPGMKLGYEASAVVLMLNSSVNPFIYCWKIKEIRQAVKATVRQLGCFSS
ncbi:adenosine receptor A2a-like [Oculina patagonica]